MSTNPAIPGNGQIVHTLGNIGFIPVNLDAQNTYLGFYATDTFDITAQLSLTAGATSQANTPIGSAAAAHTTKLIPYPYCGM